jgi:hypothetical protein
MTHFERHELPILAEVWRADAAGQHPDWQTAADAAGIERNDVPQIIWQLDQAGYIATDLPRRASGYLPFPMSVRVKAKGRAALGEGPDGIDAALDVIRLTIEHADDADPELVSKARQAYDVVASGATTFNALAQVAATVARLLDRCN